MTESEIEAQLVLRLRGELAASELASAHECPSWRVYADWLLDRGDPLGEWLTLTLEHGAARSLTSVVEASIRASESTLDRPARDRLRALVRNKQGWTQWFGPFALASVQPGIDAETLAATLGRHGALLLERRTWVGDVWIEAALARQPGSPALLTVDDSALLAPLSAALAEVERRRSREAPLLARPGEAMPVVYPPIPPINPGPIYDADAMRRAVDEMLAASMARILAASAGVLCCRDEQDIRRHADDWARIQQLGACVLLGPREVLERWPHAGRWLA